jgi:hypothetical protein
MDRALKIALLDDDPDRIRAMLDCLVGRFSEFETVVFDNAPDMIDWLAEHLEETALICLDHDLGPNRTREGKVFDPGTGRDVADFLATQSSVCPVVIHTTNSLAAPGMALVLEDSGWPHFRIVPYNDLEWVEADWIGEVAKALSRGC